MFIGLYYTLLVFIFIITHCITSKLHICTHSCVPYKLPHFVMKKKLMKKYILIYKNVYRKIIIL